MHSAQIPRLNHFDRSIGEIVRRSVPKAALKLFVRVTLGVQMRRMTRDLERIVNEHELIWKSLLKDVRGRTGVVQSDGSEARRLARELSDAGNEIQAISAEPFEKFFPGFSKRMQAAVEKSKRMQSMYRPAILFEGDKDMVINSQRHYTEGSLMDLETFANGLQRY